MPPLNKMNQQWHSAYAHMSNHVHVILRNRPDVVALWSDQEVARRWLALFPGRVGNKPDPTFALAALPGPTAEPARSISPGTPAMPPGREPADPLEQAVGMLSADPALMATIRGRLSSLSWFMRALAEPIARRANRELDWTGRQLRGGTRGVIPLALASILDRLQVSAESWLETIARFGRQFHRAVGLSDHLKVEARRLGVNRLHGLRWSQVAFAHSPCP